MATWPRTVPLDTQTKQITHAIRMAAYNTETTLARNLQGHYARAGDEEHDSGDPLLLTSAAHDGR